MGVEGRLAGGRLEEGHLDLKEEVPVEVHPAEGCAGDRPAAGRKVERRGWQNYPPTPWSSYPFPLFVQGSGIA